MKEFLKGIPITTGILIYLYLCGGLYLIGFWSTFEIEVSNFVSLAEIPLSFILPFIISGALYLINTAWTLVTSDLTRDPEVSEEKVVKEASQTDINKPGGKAEQVRSTFVIKCLKTLGFLKLLFLSIDFYFGLYVVLVLSFGTKYSKSPTFWIIVSAALILILSVKIATFERIKRLIRYRKIRLQVIQLIISVPILSFGIGKARSYYIYNNTQIKYINARIAKDNMPIFPITDTARLKLLGFLGSKIIISTLDNKKIIILNQDIYSAVQIDEGVTDLTKDTAKSVPKLLLKVKPDSDIIKDSFKIKH